MTTKLPTYISHKRVQAAEIVSVGYYSVVGEDDQLMRSITLKDHFEPVQVASEAFHRYVPLPGDFLVIYEDGYVSFSPRKAFVDGYTLAQPENVLMERLNDLATTQPGTASPPEWLAQPTWAHEIKRIAREAYVTINSLKQQVERLQEQITPRADGTAITDRIIEAIAQNPNEPFITGELQDLLRACYSEITRLRADVTVTRQMAGFKEVKREKADPDQA